ncbi:MAG: hypothetical protein D5R99_08200 [Methanocalculus sp. MSAO_Arc1]|uniref:hypothetical protein n=1 Tax=Methanocalculus TaxID=71151 RepID=UPI000FF5B53F|nr:MULTISPECIES: hypothetical protein [unclassified Methanocalculus]MCP1661777.1 hypothetical protein [Methanocalculus sp. AMF5]RQD79428.1 MAG: hypothetical protein D5R99_08200 [Methanocalculus sp. MSAO_Arc1]
MKTGISVAILLLLAACCMPVAAEEPGTRFSYITFDSVDIILEETTATVTVDYNVDPGVQLLVMLLGNHDLRNKVQRAMNFEESTILSADLNQAVLEVESASFDYGDDTYWFPRHTFLVTVPRLTIETPSTKREFSNVYQTEDGIGFFTRQAERSL